MKKLLKRIETGVWHFKDGLRVEGAHDRLGGDLSKIHGDVTNLHGDVSNIKGDLTNVRGDLTGVKGDLTNVHGDLDNCGITPEDRQKGVRIENLIENLTQKGTEK